MAAIYRLLLILGSLGVFLYGMRLLSSGLQQAAGSKLQQILAHMTSNRFVGVLTGFTVTAIIQSSSATTVLVVGFVDAALLTLRQAIGVILGANIGTTVTGWLVALLGFKFSITSAALPAVAVGMTVILIKKLDRTDIAEIFLGFGFLFLGLSLLKDSVPDIRSNPEILEFLSHYTDLGFLSFIIFIVAGAILTIVVQSSSAAMAITLTMAFSGWIDYPTAAAVVLGENIGTTVTAYLASLDASANAKRAARAHTIFNLIGVIWISLVFRPFLGFVDQLVPGASTSRAALTTQLAMFHTLFNVANTLVCIGFVPLLERAVRAIVPEGREVAPAEYRFPYMNVGFQETAELNVLRARAELAKMGEHVEEIFQKFVHTFFHPSPTSKEHAERMDKKLDLVIRMREEITAFLIECSRESVNEATAVNVNELIRITNMLESIADSSRKLLKLAAKKADKGLVLGPKVEEQVVPYVEMVQNFLAFNKAHLENHLSEEQYEKAYQFEQQINKVQKKLKKNSRKRLKTGASVNTEMFYIDVLRHLEHLGDFSLIVSRSLAQLR
jgi:phosphate:Na+ symporter